MEAKDILLSVVCPAFNEEQVLPLFHQQLTAVLNALAADYRVEIIYVDDGSRDGTLEVLRELVRRDARVRFLSFSRNFGHQAALSAGMEAAGGDVVVTMDCDLQHPPALLPTLLERWRAGYDVVITIRDDSQSPNPVEHFLSCFFYSLMRWVSDTEIRPAAADFRLLSRPAMDALLSMGDRNRFLRGMVQWLGFPTAEVSYVAARRGAGHSKYSFGRKVRLALDGILSFSRLPLRLPLALGGAAMAYGLAATGCALVRTLLGWGETDAFRSLLLGSLYLLGGGILCVQGVFGEYLGRIHDQVRDRPLYVVKEESHPAAGKGRGLTRRGNAPAA